MFLCRSYAVQGPNGIKAIWDLGNSIFRKEIDLFPELLQKVISAMLSTIEMIRMGDATNGEILGRVTHMLTTLQFYHSTFEVAFVQDSIRFFTLEGTMLISQVETAKFLFHVDRRIFESIEITSKYLDPSSRKLLLEIVDNHLLKPHVNTLLEKGFKFLMDESRRDDLKRMFYLFDRVKSLELLKVGWSMYIRCGAPTFFLSFLSPHRRRP